MQPWTRRTIFIVDKVHTDRWGADQQRQRIEAANLKSEKVFDLLDEEIHSTKSRWTKLSIHNHGLEDELEDFRKRPGKLQQRSGKDPAKPGV